MDFPRVAACGTGMAEVVRGVRLITLISGFRSKLKG